MSLKTKIKKRVKQKLRSRKKKSADLYGDTNPYQMIPIYDKE